jgi:mannosylglycerate hydrolase
MQTLHVVSHTHWDREWYLTFQQFRLKLVQLVDGLLDILENDPEFKYFTLDGQTIVLEDYLHMRPEREADLRKYIHSGRIIIGPWHILPDEFLVSPEAHIRNLIEGDRTTRKFGARKMPIGYLPDTFGHIGQMPQILRGFGIDTACLWRGLDDEPAELWWQSPDGSRVLLAYLRDSYSNGASLPTDNLPLFTQTLSTQADSLAAASAVSDYLIMLGTDHMQPPPNTSEAIAYADEMLANRRVLHSTLPEYICAIQTALETHTTELPTVQGELRACKHSQLLPGVLSTRMWIKQRNRASETLLEKWVEPFTTFAELVRDRDPHVPAPQLAPMLRQPADIIRQAWRLLMENHPHDSICGCGIDQIHAEMKVRFDQVDQIGEVLTTQSLETLAAAIDTQHETGTAEEQALGAIVVFNPNSTPRSDIASIDLSLPPDIVAYEIVDDTGQSIPYETTGLGQREVANVVFNRKEMLNALNSIHDGRVMDLGIVGLRFHRQGNTVLIDAVLTTGNPDLVTWERSLLEGQQYLEDSTVTTFQVRARTADSRRVVFSAAQVPGLGWRTYFVRSKASASSAPVQLPALARWLMPLATRLADTSLGKSIAHRLQSDPANKPPYRIQNEFFILEAGRDGSLTLHDLKSGIVYSGLNRFMDGGDAGDEYNYSPPESDHAQVFARFVGASVHRGPVQQTLEIALELLTPAELAPNRKSRSTETVSLPIITRMTLSAGVPRVDVQTVIENTARDHRLRVHFPTPFPVETALQDGHFEIISRPAHSRLEEGRDFSRATWVEDPRPEVPQRAFCAVMAGEAGLMIANRGLPEVEVHKTDTGSEIILTLLRCVGWLSRDDFTTRRGHAGPQLPTPGSQLPGAWTFEYSFIPFNLSGSKTPPYDLAYGFEAPLRAASTPLHSGTLAHSGAFIEVNPAEFLISAVKQVENGEGWLVRGYNIKSQPIQVTLRPWQAFKQSAQINLAEEKQADLPPSADRRVTFTARGHEIFTVKFWN